MDNTLVFFLIVAIVGGLVSGLLGGTSNKVQPSKNIFSFFFFDRY